ncbi:MAG: hypothetical protein HY536_01605 [Candidatus Colwellbacteria bacterium]|nr:hypothetical protein [Candidatus Colwellbacteria bacterium]
MFGGFRQRIVWNGIVTLLILGALGAFLWVELRALGRTADAIASVRRALRLQIADADLLTRLRGESKRAASASSLLENALPKRDQIFTFSEDVARLARERGIDVSFAFGKETPASPEAPGIALFTMNVRGSYGAINELMSLIEKSRYLVRFSDADLVSQDKVFRGTVAGEVYFR